MISVLLLLGVPSGASARVRRYRSSDGRLTVHVVDVGKPGFVDEESRVDVRTASGGRVASRSFGSYDGEHGKRVTRGAWTRGGRWFVFSCENAGGHMPWNRPTFVFDGRTKRFHALDNRIGPVTSDFELAGADAVVVNRMNTDTLAQDERVVVRLARLFGK